MYSEHTLSHNEDFTDSIHNRNLHSDIIQFRCIHAESESSIYIQNLCTVEHVKYISFQYTEQIVAVFLTYFTATLNIYWR